MKKAPKSKQITQWAIENPGYFWSLLSLYYPFRLEDLLRYREYLNTGGLLEDGEGKPWHIFPGLICNSNLDWEDDERLLMAMNLKKAGGSMIYPIQVKTLLNLGRENLEVEYFHECACLLSRTDPEHINSQIKADAEELKNNHEHKVQLLESQFRLNQSRGIASLEGLNQRLNEISEADYFFYLNPYIWECLFKGRINIFLIEEVFTHFEVLIESGEKDS